MKQWGPLLRIKLVSATDIAGIFKHQSNKTNVTQSAHSVEGKSQMIYAKCLLVA